MTGWPLFAPTLRAVSRSFDRRTWALDIHYHDLPQAVIHRIKADAE